MKSPWDAQAKAQEAGSRTFNGPQMIYKPKPQLITRAAGVVGTWSGRVRLPVPDSRCRVKMSVIFWPRAGAAVPVALKKSGTIWVAAYEEDTEGVSGSGGQTAPVQDIGDETSDVPLAFPVSAALQGYSREFVTAADWIEAVITLTGAATIVGQWTLQTRIQPDAGALFTWQEWDQIRGNFAPYVFGSGSV